MEMYPYIIINRVEIPQRKFTIWSHEIPIHFGYSVNIRNHDDYPEIPVYI